MPGLFAAVDFAARADLEHRFERMHRAGQPQPFPQADRWADPAAGVALGRVDLGLLNPGHQPVVDGTGRHHLVFQGEIRDRAARHAALAARGSAPAGDGHADLLLATYRAEGLAGLERLNGSFFFVLWDAEAGELVAGGDRYGSRPHFYSLDRGRLYLAPDLKAILAARGDAPPVDHRGLAEFMALEYPLADRTHFAGIHVFPAGTWLVASREGLAWRPYWEPRYRAADPPPDERTWLEQAEHLYRQAVRRCMTGDFAVALSGGTDSRLLLAVSERADFPTYTFGTEASEDVRVARRIAEAVGVRHHMIPISPDFMACNAEAIMTWGEGMVSLFHGHNGDQLAAKRAVAPIVLRGMTAEYCRLDAVEAILAEPPRSRAHQLALLTHHALAGRKRLSAFASDEALVDRVLAHVWTAITPAAAREVLEPEFAALMAAAVRQGVSEALAPIQADTLEDRLATFNVWHRQRRFSPWGLRTCASVMESRKPLDDYDLVDFLLATPPERRRKLQERIICRAAPALAAIPRTGTGVAIDAGYWQRAAAYGSKLLASRLKPGRVQSFADPQDNLRTHARRFYEGLLLDAATLNNGYFRPEGVRRLLARHLEGSAQAASVLCMLATVELWRRRYAAGAVRQRPDAA